MTGHRWSLAHGPLWPSTGRRTAHGRLPCLPTTASRGGGCPTGCPHGDGCSAQGRGRGSQQLPSAHSHVPRTTGGCRALESPPNAARGPIVSTSTSMSTSTNTRGGFSKQVAEGIRPVIPTTGLARHTKIAPHGCAQCIRVQRHVQDGVRVQQDPTAHKHGPIFTGVPVHGARGRPLGHGFLRHGLS